MMQGMCMDCRGTSWTVRHQNCDDLYAASASLDVIITVTVTATSYLWQAMQAMARKHMNNGQTLHIIDTTASVLPVGHVHSSTMRAHQPFCFVFTHKG
jgi:hypothetical protein